MSANRPTMIGYVGLTMVAWLWMTSIALFAAEPAVTPRDPPRKIFTTEDRHAPWKLAGREGECVPLDMLSRRGSVYGDIKSPKELADKLKANGHQVEMKEYKAGTRPAVEVRAPSARIHVMFVRQEHCDQKPPAEEK